MFKRRNQWGWIAPVLVLLTGVAILFAVVSLRPQPPEAPADEPYLPSVSVLEVELVEAHPRVVTTGLVTSRFEINLVSQVGGVVESVSPGFRRGASFTQGDLLLQLEDTNYQSQLAQAEANLAAAEQQLANEQGLARQAEREWRDLGNDQANALFLRKPQLAAASAQLQAASAALQRAQLDLQRTTIRAPFDGVIVSVNANLGQYIGPGSSAALLNSTAELQVETALSDTELKSLGWNRTAPLNDLPAAHLSSSQLPRPVEAQVRHVSPRLDPMTQLTAVLLDVESTAADPMTAGQFVQVELYGPASDDLAWIPESALYERNSVLRVVDGMIELAPISLISREENRLLVRGLGNGELIVVERPLWVFPGQQVEPVRLEP